MRDVHHCTKQTPHESLMLHVVSVMGTADPVTGECMQCAPQAFVDMPQRLTSCGTIKARAI